MLLILYHVVNYSVKEDFSDMALLYPLLRACFPFLFLFEFVRSVEDGRYHSEELGPCQACKVFVESFEKGLQRTANTPSESTHAVLEEIQKGLCEEPRSKLKCLQTAALARPFVEEWSLHQDKPDLFAYICIEKLEVCCPKHHFGKQCLPCHGDLGNVCSGHGKCRGDGTRKGNGTCLCDPGYGGEFCNECVAGYYMNTEDPTQIVCSRCHYSCMGGCRNGTPRDCVACRPGFIFDTDEGCQDINECNNIHICTKDEYCLNSKGSYKCMACDKACKGCYGDSPDMCRKCAKGFSKKGDLCIQDREDEEMDQMTVTRYMTYIGLLVTASVVLPKSSALGSAVGAIVLAYIVGAEYYCAVNGHASLLDLAAFTV